MMELRKHLILRSPRSGRLEGRTALLPSAGRAVTLDGFGVGRIGAHVDAALPAALERVDDFEAHAADLLDLDLDALAVLQGAEPLMVGAARDQIARVQCHDRGGELDE